jgi:hypothetical protein
MSFVRPMNTSLPIHDQAMPAMLMTTKDVGVWLTASDTGTTGIIISCQQEAI